MRRASIAYSVFAIWMFGWLVGTFGLSSSILAASILLIPSALAFRMLSSSRAVKGREYAYLGLTATAAVVATAFIVSTWFGIGIDRLAMFEREYRSFEKQVSSMPEFKGVEVSYTRRKGGRVYLHGHVANKESHARLLQMFERMIRNNEAGYFDGVKYPGKPDSADGQATNQRKKRIDELVALFITRDCETLEDVRRVVARAAEAEVAVLFIHVDWAPMEPQRTRFAELAYDYGEKHPNAELDFQYIDCTPATEGYAPLQELDGWQELQVAAGNSLIHGKGEVVWLRQGRAVHVEPILNFRTTSALLQETEEMRQRQ